MNHQVKLSFLIALVIHFVLLFPYGNFSRLDFNAKAEELIEVELLAKRKPKPPPKKIIKKKRSKPKPKKVIEPPKNEPEIEEVDDTDADTYDSNKDPIYPKIAIRKGWQGTVIIMVEVLKDGSIGSIKLSKSSGKKILDKSALKAVATWKFYPATNNGKTVKSWLKVPVKFELK